ncbi:hypothetical protein GBAR_LOCUS7412 [Geodia barretti]|uniref:Uncharacterized protein n=1 Tax=Geodia barretti TaxID=519541 RepID=A0AA35WBU7_GEOBA|nr:hypothetical protein GBAR_LOCUS7412 [Geodia barretti]
MVASRQRRRQQNEQLSSLKSSILRESLIEKAEGKSVRRPVCILYATASILAKAVFLVIIWPYIDVYVYNDGLYKKQWDATALSPCPSTVPWCSRNSQSCLSKKNNVMSILQIPFCS